MFLRVFPILVHIHGFRLLLSVVFIWLGNFALLKSGGSVLNRAAHFEVCLRFLRMLDAGFLRRALRLRVDRDELAIIDIGHITERVFNDL